MAHRRSIIARAKLFYQHQQQQQQRRLPFSFPYLTCSDREQFPTQTISTNSQICSRFLMKRNSSLLSANVSRLMRFRIPASYSPIFHRDFSNVPSDIEDLDFNGAAGAVGDKAVEAAPVINEVAIAAADSCTPVAAFQHLIGYVHCITGFEWWACIAVTTLLIRFIHLPSGIYELNLMLKHAPKIEKWIFMLLIYYYLTKTGRVKQSVIPKNLIKEDNKHFLQIGLVMGYVYPCILFFAIQNMVEKVPSFMTGGTLWFTDLTTPDHSMGLPLLVALTLWLRMELDVRLYLPRQAISAERFHTTLALLAVAAIATTRFPSAIPCYWITSNLFSAAFAIVMMYPEARKMLGASPIPSSTRKKSK